MASNSIFNSINSPSPGPFPFEYLPVVPRGWQTALPEHLVHDGPPLLLAPVSFGIEGGPAFFDLLPADHLRLPLRVPRQSLLAPLPQRRVLRRPIQAAVLQDRGNCPSRVGQEIFIGDGEDVDPQVIATFLQGTLF